ncbi:MAG: hypothetical protein HRT44_00155 [Bdellovibrionales bacterium]|nr:hypothetical protein [Bdellovibrionales bacterium]NQZ17668.1 hypothetical protein [Bdellovibrionales bacterium]
MGLLKKIFGGSKGGAYKNGKDLVDEILQGTVERAGLEISFDVTKQKDGDLEIIKIDFYGEDERLFTSKDGALLDAFQLFLRRSIQHHFPKEETQVSCDCNGYREKANQSLVDLAEKLKKKAIDQGKSVYLRALPPKDRKVIHQFLAEDGRVKSRSVGDGLYKKIKIYPVKKDGGEAQTTSP